MHTEAADVPALLAEIEPFNALTEAVRAQLAVAARTCSYAPDLAILVEDGPPADSVWLIIEGSVQLIHDGQQILVLERGECFGHPSLLTGLPPAYTVRTREPTRCARFPPAAAGAFLGTAAGVTYVARTMRARLVSQGYATQNLPDIGTTPVSAIVRPPRFIDGAAPARDALALLADPALHAVLIRAGDGRATGLISDGDVRAAVAAGALSLDAPSATIARPPTVIPVGQLAVEAVVDMLAAGADCVVVADGPAVVGTLSAADLLGLDARGPIALRHTILGAADEDGLIRSVAHLPQLFQLLFGAGVPPRDLGRVLSLQHDAIVSRLLDFSISRHGPAPTAWAWLDLGSAARREFTLASDQDNGLAYADAPTESAGDLDPYFARLGTEVNDGLMRCGIGRDNNGVLAGDRNWRMSKAAWVRSFDECLRIPDESHLIRATVAFDFRSAAGGLALTAELTGRIRAAPSHPDFMRLMARTGSGYPVALGRRGRLATGRLDEPPGLLDIKRGAIIPLVNLVRYHALAAGVTISPTLDRIEAVASLGELDRSYADALREAWEVISTVRFRHHAEQIAAGVPLDNLVDPSALTELARGGLEEALQAVRRGQRRIEVLGGAR